VRLGRKAKQLTSIRYVNQKYGGATTLGAARLALTHLRTLSKEGQKVVIDESFKQLKRELHQEEKRCDALSRATARIVASDPEFHYLLEQSIDSCIRLTRLDRQLKELKSSLRQGN
jgi:hypothetical protein